MFTVPPTRADTAERAAAAQRVQRGRRLGEDAWRAEGDRRYESAQPKVSGQAGQHAQRDPWLGYRFPGPADLRDLDQVIHQRDATEPGGRRRFGDPAEPGGWVIAPAEPGDL